MHSVTKFYGDLPAAHRQPKHDGHCRLIHGHNWGFKITFTCADFDDCGFVIDVGKLKAVKAFLEDYFDHTLLLNDYDPLLVMTGEKSILAKLNSFASIKFVPNCGMEGLAQFVLNKVNELIHDKHVDGKDRGLICSRVTCFEDSKNFATFSIPELSEKDLE